MGKKANIIGNRYGRLIVLKEAECAFSKEGHKQRRYFCKCDCNNTKIIRQGALVMGTTVSCGCFLKESASKRFLKHGLINHQLYGVFKGIKARCYYKNHIAYKWYGGNEITICDEWRNNPKRFIEWAIENGWRNGLQIDRINNNLGYSPNNCRFVTSRVNILNKKLINSTNLSGYRGVSFYKKRQKWGSSICINYKQFFLGQFKIKQDAVNARNQYIIDNNLQHEYKVQEWHGNESTKQKGNYHE